MSVDSVMLFIDMLAGLSTFTEDSQNTFDGNTACVILTTQQE